jgi:hypothetical protein
MTSLDVDPEAGIKRLGLASSLSNKIKRKRGNMKAIAIVFFAACGFAFAGVPEGKVVYEARCQKCHGENGEGKPTIAKMLKVELKPLGSKDVQAKPDAEIKKIINSGQGKMKPIPDLTGKPLDDVIAFMRTLK